jgi:all-trans-retinol 13,14-reductase
MSQRDYDAIVIGSGIGGMAAAAILARIKGLRVLVLERHYVLGGFTHEFRRKGGHSWDVGVHYIGDLRPGDLGRVIFDFISGGKLQWHKMPEPFERFVYPDGTFDLYGDPKRFRADLCERFPEEREAIERYFVDLRKANTWGLRYFTAKTLPLPLAKVLEFYNGLTSKNVLGTTAEYLDRNFKSPKLKALLVSQWRTHGLTPERSAFLVHAVLAQHYLRGGWYPRGGSSSIAETIRPVIEAAGGEFLVRHEVRRVIIENGRAVGVEAVRLRAGTEEVKTYRAPIVISDAGAWNTYKRLLPEEIGADRARELEALGKAPTGVTLYLGLKRSPAELGFRGENYWISTDFCHDADVESHSCLAGKPTGAYLSFPSLKNPDATHHSAEILCLPDFEPFAAWKDERWQHRGEDYEALKERIGDGMLELVERNFPGFSDLVEVRELSTPLSVETFTAWRGGAIYGLPLTPARFRIPWLGVKTPVRGLYLAGADVYLHGIMGALMGGVAAAAAVFGWAGFPRVMSKMFAAAKKSGSPSVVDADVAAPTTDVASLS